jgi:DNA-binding transcriptional MerR regulator
MDADRSRLLTISRFSELTWLTPKMLRHYDRISLLSPAIHDPDTGYRYYDPGQVQEAELIRLLRDLDVPLEEIREALRRPGHHGVDDVLRRQRDHMVARRVEAERVIARVDRALRGGRGLMPYEVGLVELDPQLVVSRRQRARQDQLDDVQRGMIADLTKLAEAHAAGSEERETVLYHSALWHGLVADMELCLPLSGRRAGSVPGAWELPGGPAARVLHVGPWDDIRSAYVALFAWIVEHGREPTAPIREAYLVDDRDTDDSSEYVTSLTWPLTEG